MRHRHRHRQMHAGDFQFVITFTNDQVVTCTSFEAILPTTTIFSNSEFKAVPLTTKECSLTNKTNDDNVKTFKLKLTELNTMMKDYISFTPENKPSYTQNAGATIKEITIKEFH